MVARAHCGLAWDGLGDVNLRDLRCYRSPSPLVKAVKFRGTFSFSPILPYLKSCSIGESQFNADCMHPGPLYPFDGPSPCSCIELGSGQVRAPISYCAFVHDGQVYSCFHKFIGTKTIFVLG